MSMANYFVSKSWIIRILCRMMCWKKWWQILKCEIRKTWISAHWVRMWVRRIWQERKFCSWLDLVLLFIYSLCIWVFCLHVCICMYVYIYASVHIYIIYVIYNIYTAYTYQQYLIMHNGVCIAYISCAHRKGQWIPWNWRYK